MPRADTTAVGEPPAGETGAVLGLSGHSRRQQRRLNIEMEAPRTTAGRRRNHPGDNREAVSKLPEWSDIEAAVSDARTDFRHAGQAEHRRRRTERVTPVEVLKPLIGNVVLDTRQAKTDDG